MNIGSMAASIFLGIVLASAAVIGYAADDEKSRLSVTEFIKRTAITAKIKAEMIADNEVSALNIKVDTDDKGVVKLSGTANQVEAERAVSIALNVTGVTAVANNILIPNNNKR